MQESFGFQLPSLIIRGDLLALLLTVATLNARNVRKNHQKEDQFSLVPTTDHFFLFLRKKQFVTQLH